MTEVNPAAAPPNEEAVRASNKIAAALSTVLPGAGQVYKGHIAVGLLWMLVGMPLAIWIGILLSLATAGLGLVIPILCWVAVVVDAYAEVDLRRRRHHHLAEPTMDETYD